MTDQQNQAAAPATNPIEIARITASLLGVVSELVVSAENDARGTPGIGATKKAFVMQVLGAAFVDAQEVFEDARAAIETYIDNKVTLLNASGAFRRSPPPQPAALSADALNGARRARTARPMRATANEVVS